MKLGKLFFWSIIFQIFVLNNIQYSGYINPFYYIIFIVSIRETKLISLLLSFMMGIIIDYFSNSFGMHAFSCVLISYLRPFIYNSTKHINEDIKFMGFDFFLIRTFIIVSIHHFTLFILEDFDLLNILPIIMKTITSAIFTMILLMTHKAALGTKNEI